MKNIKFALAVLAISSLSAQAADKGGIFLEPMLTYETGTSDVDFPSPIGPTESEFSAIGIGGRAGAHVHDAIFLGLDARYSRVSFENDDTDLDTDGSSYNYGPVVGLQVPGDFGIRVWGTYILDAGMDLKEDNNLDVKFEDGSGYRLGAGIKLAMVSLNLEYQHIEYDKTQIRDSGFFAGPLNNTEAESDSYILSVSFPISL